MPSDLSDPIINGLARAMAVHQRRHEVLAANIANVDTPGFRARETDFRAALEQAFDAAETRATPRPGRVVEDTSTPPRADGNTVDLDLQMAKLSENTGTYQTLARILGKRFGLLRHAIEGTR